MDYAIGDILCLLIPAFDPSKPDKILFPEGTTAEIDSISGQNIGLKFPDGVVYAHEAIHLPRLFKKINQGKMLICDHAGVGTPPKMIFPMLPEGADWKKNYVWKVSISLEEKEDKNFICQLCTSEILDLEKKNDKNYIQCPSCKEYVIPFNLKTNTYLFEDLEINSTQ